MIESSELRLPDPASTDTVNRYVPVTGARNTPEVAS